MRSPLFVFLSWFPKTSDGTRREVFFLFRLPSGRSIKYATFLSCFEWNDVRTKAREKEKIPMSEIPSDWKYLCRKIRHFAG